MVLGSTVLGITDTAATGAPPSRFASSLAGFNLIAWERSSLTRDKPWKQAIDDIHAVGVRRIALVPYVLFDEDQQRLVKNSQYELVAGPGAKVLGSIVAHARTLGMSVGVKPLVEIDNANGEGDIWRGKLKLDQAGIETFFESYGSYLLKVCRTVIEQGANRFYAGSELAGLTADPATHEHWNTLIAALRSEIGGSSCIVSYAANYSEYEAVPFWSELDEIGIDAYFPLATRKAAEGPGRPGRNEIKQRFAAVLNRLEAFSAAQERPVMLAEWGVVPFDLTTVEPSDEAPSEIPDPEEALNAYAAVIEVLSASERPWLRGIDFWHWSVGETDSNYRLDRQSPVMALLR